MVLAQQMLTCWNLGGAALEQVPVGHINRTFLVEAQSGRFVLQWLNPIFSPDLHHDIEAVTARLESRGITTPRLVRTASRNLWTVDDRGDLWRLFTYVPGETLAQADSADRCYQAGRLLGSFHRALWDFDYQLRHGRFHVHDTVRHLKTLEEALQEHASHRDIDSVRPVAEDILSIAGILVLDRSWKKRLVHGDPKISNVVFAPDGTAVCLIDLDTFNRMPIAVELGDALRSWCSPQGEEAPADLDIHFFEASLLGYAEGIGGLPEPEEVRAIPALVEIISVELSARFCADALNESYFDWDRSRFPSASVHNLARARSQLSLARSVRQRMDELERINRSIWRLSE